ncbi:ABC-F family ATP-binding cassette domain-containing protein [Candidatus Gracilibacteria bacterium]|nr:ABC-F family ATP-binding cassette domain-containing protein [Candidatus Gracilibacteria bacterium]
MAQNNGTIISFDHVTFGFKENRPLLDEVSFSVRQGSKITIMGQNGAGKSTILKLMTGVHKAKSGSVNLFPGFTVGTAQQVIPHADRELTVTDYFHKHYSPDGEKAYDISRHINAVLEVVNFHAPHDRIIKSFSGGQQARLLLASALISNPDLLLLDEPTNNLDRDGIDHLTGFLLGYDKTCIVISHDSDFLNSFTDGVLYLDVHTKKVEQYEGNYFDVQEQIANRIEKENQKNARLEKEAQAKKEQANVFANKGGNLRFVAKRMREAAAEMEESMVDVRREDKTIREFEIPMQPDVKGEVFKITSFSMIKDHKAVTKKCKISLNKKTHLLLTGPNGIGKSTLLESLANGTAKGATITPGIEVGYYRQDFSTLNFDDTVYDSLLAVAKDNTEQHVRSIAAGFLITGEVVHNTIGSLSEGQKGLVAFARLVLQEPGLLILDEPTNHINFRHIPVIARALDAYEGAMILVSHVPEFVSQIRIDQTLDLEA